jgi:SAM-dependent methyltransferase
MSQYNGRHAELYDLIYQAKPYENEARFVSQCVQQYCKAPRTKLLELACGTGRHARLFARDGFDVVATDSSQAMLQVASDNAQREGEKVDFRLQDMRKLPAPPEPYDVAVCLFDSIGYVHSDAGVSDVLRGIHSSLRPGDLFLFDFCHAPAMLNHFEPLRVARFSAPGRTILRISRTRLLRGESLARVSYEILELRDDHTYEEVAETHTNRYFQVPEMSEMAARHGFSPHAYFDGFKADGTITDQSWHIVAAWERN